MLGADRGAEAAREFARALDRVRPGRGEEEILELAELIAERDRAAAVAALENLGSADLSRQATARLFILLGDVHRALGQGEDARSAYRAAISRAPDSRPAVDAYRGRAELALEGAESADDLVEGFELLQRGSRIPVGRRVTEIYDLMGAVQRVQFWIEHGGLGHLAAAEVARDQLHAPKLARALFLEYAREQPDDLWTAKAILAALELTPVDSTGGSNGDPPEPDRADLRRRLLEDYRSSPYVQVLLVGQPEGVAAGETTYNYEELEEGLRRQLERLRRLADQQLDPARGRGTNRP